MVNGSPFRDKVRSDALEAQRAWEQLSPQFGNLYKSFGDYEERFRAIGGLERLFKPLPDLENLFRSLPDLENLSKPLLDLGELLKPLLDFEERFRPMRETYASVSRTAQAVVAAASGPGTLYGDLRLVQRERDPEALRRLSVRLGWYPYDPRARAAMRRREAELGRESARELTFGAALILALARAQEPQRIRLGAQYLKDDADDRPALVTPDGLPWELYWRWLRKETINAMEADLLEGGMADAHSPDQDEWTPDEAPGPEEVTMLAELARERMELFAALNERCTPAERELLAALYNGAETPADAARELGIAPATARVQLRNIRSKVRSA